MKILYVNSPECDYLQDLLFSGFVKLFGADQVFDYPMNKRYRFIDKKYPRNLGYNLGWPSFVRPFQSLNQEFDLVVVGSCKHLAMQSYAQIMDRIPSSTPVVFIDGGDQTPLGGDLIFYKSEFVLSNIEKKRRFDLIFKREFIQGDPNYDERIIPLPFCMNMDRVDLKQSIAKKYDVAFWAVESHAIRVKALDMLQGLFDCQQNGTTRHQTFKKYKRKGAFYLEELARCKISLNFRGGGWDTMRYWETPAVGSFMITPKPGIFIPNDFENAQHVVHCREDLSDLVELCDHYLKNEKERERIAQSGHQHLLNYHTDRARAQTVVDSVMSLLKS